MCAGLRRFARTAAHSSLSYRVPVTSIAQRAPVNFRPLAALLCAFALGCNSMTDPALPSSAERFAPPPVYARWWTLVESCSGISRPLGAVQFYRVPNTSTISDGSDSVSGYWSSASNRIVLAERVAGTGGIVRHEMLHALVRRGGHPPEYFQGRCRGVVECPAVGCQDAGRPASPAPPGAPEVPLSSLDVRIEALPDSVPHTGPDSALTLIVRVTNPHAEPVWLPLDTTLADRPPWIFWYGFRIVPVGQPLPVADITRIDAYGMVTVDSVQHVPFAAGQTREWVVDVSGAWYAPGNYMAVGIFNARQVWTPLTVLH